VQEITTSEHEISVEILDFSQNLSSDILKDRSYDVVLASGLSIYASKPELVVENVTKVLKDGGRLCILVNDSAVDHILPLFALNQFDTIVFHDLETTQVQKQSLFIATKKVPYTNGVNGHSEPEKITIIQAANPSSAATTVASQLTMSLENHGYEISTFTWGSDVTVLAGKSCISLLELQESLFQDLGAKDFDFIKKLILNTASLFWVTGFEDPSASIIDGLARVVRNETPGLSFRTFHAEQRSIFSAGHLAELLDRSFHSKTEDDEFQVKNGIIHISRIEEDSAFNRQINGLLPGTPKMISNQALKDINHPVKLCIQTPGLLDSICMEADDLPETELEPDYIEIQIKATALK
jgi:hypothetical protein